MAAAIAPCIRRFIVPRNGRGSAIRRSTRRARVQRDVVELPDLFSCLPPYPVVRMWFIAEPVKTRDALDG